MTHVADAMHLGKKTAKVLIGLAIMALPGAILSATVIPRMTGVVMIGVFPAISGVLANGPRLGLALVAITAPLGALAVLASPYPLLATLLVGLVAGGAALWSRRGLESPVLMVPVALGFLVSEPGHFLAGRTITEGSWQLALVTGAGLLIGGLWTVLVGKFAFAKLPRKPLVPVERDQALRYALSVGIATGIATWFATAVFPGTSAAWAILTVILVMKPGRHDMTVRTAHRILGTLGGGAIAGIVLGVAQWLHVPSSALVVLGITLLGVALATMSSVPYWKYVMTLTPAIVFLEGSETTGYDLTFERVAFTLLGAGLAIGAGLLVNVVAQSLHHRRSTASHR